MDSIQGLLGVSLGLKSMTLYASLALYAVCVVYALALLLAPRLQKTTGADKALKKKPGQMRFDDILQHSQQADAYEKASEPYTAEYLSDLCVQLGEQFELEPAELESLRVAALLHDIGQVERYDFIQEPRRLRPDEKRYLEEHPIHGARFIQDNLGASHEQAAKWVRWSHERWDGTGYPDALSGEQIPLPARILAVADAYCAMMQDRPHRPALHPEQVIQELNRYAGIYYDPRIVQLLGVPDELADTSYSQDQKVSTNSSESIDRPAHNKPIELRKK
jgi:HD-GYP domain-containing protein (c-di-GMP phosphodiesterase class II)